MEEKIRLGISPCLLGEEVRYDGELKIDFYLKETIGRFVEWTPVCPEVECGLQVPREAMHLTGMPESPRLVTRETGIDHTDRMQQWTRRKLRELEKQDLCGFIFKSKSPSCGLHDIKVCNASGTTTATGAGIFARAFTEQFPLMPVEDNERLHDPDLRENFIERIFVVKRWKKLIEKSGRLRDLVEFHSDHKLLMLAHSPKHYTALGRLVADPKKYRIETLKAEYFKGLMEGLKLPATVKKNTNVLQHMIGYFKKQLGPDEKKEMAGIIDEYHRGLVPLIVPVVLIKHYVRKYDDSYLKRQYFLYPRPAEMMLRNHV